jgi:isopentenyl-diphosphate Delta-isomerase
MPLDNKKELFYHVDENDNVLGSVSREKAHKGNMIKHRSVFILLIDSDRMLFQKRSVNKDMFAKHWTLAASGHVTFGETYAEAAKKELMEEIGLKLKLKRLKKIYIPEEGEFSVIFQAEYDGNQIKIDKDEIDKVIWIKLDQIKRFVSKHKMTPGALRVLKATSYLD